MNGNKLSKSAAGRLGGLARQRKYGNFGTARGRVKGGYESIKKHRQTTNGFKLLRTIKIPVWSEELAEFLGIMMGDGHVDTYQATVTTNSKTDVVHARYILKLAKKLFNIEPSLSFKKSAEACSVVISSKAVCDYLESQGLPRGSKVALGVQIPAWVAQNKVYAYACVRGIFDTDGCVYLDRHTIRGKMYKNIGMAYVSRTKSLLQFYKSTLESLELKPTQKTPYTVFLRRAKDIDVFFKVIGSSNPKHLKKYRLFRH